MRLGEILIQRKLISAEDLERALELQKERGDKIGKTLVDMGSKVLPPFRLKPKRCRRGFCANFAAFR
jgi:hypothetical protein